MPRKKKWPYRRVDPVADPDPVPAVGVPAPGGVGGQQGELRPLPGVVDEVPGVGGDGPAGGGLLHGHVPGLGQAPAHGQAVAEEPDLPGPGGAGRDGGDLSGRGVAGCGFKKWRRMGKNIYI